MSKGDRTYVKEKGVTQRTVCRLLLGKSVIEPSMRFIPYALNASVAVAPQYAIGLKLKLGPN